MFKQRTPEEWNRFILRWTIGEDSPSMFQFLRRSDFRIERPEALFDPEKLDRWVMSQRPEPECDGRCFGCHNSLCENSLFPYDELERISVEIEVIKNDKNK